MKLEKKHIVEWAERDTCIAHGYTSSGQRKSVRLRPLGTVEVYVREGTNEVLHQAVTVDFKAPGRAVDEILNIYNKL